MIPVDKNVLRRMQGAIAAERIGLFISLLFLIVLFSSLSPYFFSRINFTNLLQSIAIIGIVSAGMTVAIISGGFDLVVGSNVALTGVVVASVLDIGIAQPWAIIVGLVIGLSIGLFNGFSIAVVRINPLITTLGMMIIVRGIAFIYSGGTSFGIYDTVPHFPSFGFWGRGVVLGVPFPVWTLFLVMFLTNFLLKHTVFGRNVYAIGGNEEAARVAGIPIVKSKMLVYVFSGVLASLSGILLASRLTAGVPTAATGLELNSVAAVVLGGASLRGGEGRIFDTLLAVMVLGILANGFVLLGLSSFWQDVARGIVLLISVGLDQIRHRSR